MVVTGELTFDRFLGDTYLDATEDELIDRALQAIRMQGLDPGALGLDRDVLRSTIAARNATAPAGPEPQPVQPQAHRKAQRARLAERSRTVAGRICQFLAVAPGGKKVAALGGTGAPTNLGAVTIMMNRAVNEFLGVPADSRGDLSIEQVDRALAALDDIADQVQAELATRLQ